MRKSFKWIFVVMLVALSLLTLAACTNPSGYTPPDNVGGTSGESGPNASGGGDNGEPVYLTFTFGDTLGGPSSIFRHYFVDEFDIGLVKARVNYRHADKSIEYFTQGAEFKLEESMVEESCRPLLKVAGNHIIKVRYNAGGTVVGGSFDLHLQDRSNVTYVDMTFNVAADESISFAPVENGKATVKVRHGVKYTYSEFISLYPIAKPDFALDGWSVNGGVFDPSSGPITINGNTELTPVWSGDKITVSFDLNLPSDVIFDETNPRPQTPAAQSAVKFKGLAARPQVDLSAVSGYTFTGWHTAKSGGEKWNFNKRVDGCDFTLYAQWERASYSLTLYLTGGEFKTSPATLPGSKSASTYSDFGASTGVPFKVQINGLTFGDRYSDYTADVGILQTTDQDGKNTVITRKMNVSEISETMNKVNGAYIFEGWYTDSRFTEGSRIEFTADTRVERDMSLYAKWKFDNTQPPESINDYYYYSMFNLCDKDKNVIKPGLKIKSDGTMAITWLYDMSISEIEIPRTITVPGTGKTYDVTEIGDIAFQACPNLQRVTFAEGSLVSKIGDHAFAYCPALETFELPQSVTEIGYQAFYGTPLQEKNAGSAFFYGDYMIANGILIAYLGDPGATRVEIPESFDNGQITIVSIGTGAFAEFKELQSVKLPSTVKRIEDKAFEKCVKLESIDFNNAVLEYVAGSAFNDTKYIQGGGDANHAFIFGNIYYRYAGANDPNVTVTISADVTIIAPGAFAGKTNVRSIVFADASKITSIGESAFSDTAWIRTPSTGEGYYISSDGFAVINDILTDYTGKASSVVVPAGVTVATNAFDNYSVVSVMFNSYKEIQSGAFKNAVNLKSVSFSSGDTGILSRPIASDAFADANGQLRDGMRFYFDSDLLAQFTQPESSIHSEWKALYARNSGIFVELTTVSAEFNAAINLPTRYLQRYKQENGSWVLGDSIRDYWLETGHAVTRQENGVDVSYLLKALQKTMSNGDTVFEDVPFGSITAPNTAGKRELSFNVTVGSAETTLKYGYTVYERINAPVYDNTANTVIDGNAEDSKMKVKDLPEVCYTSQSAMAVPETAVLKFAYLGGGASTVSITSSMMGDFRNNVGDQTILITFDYHGLATYKISYTYRVKKAEIINDGNGNATGTGMVQTKPLSLPFFADPKLYLGNGFVNIVLEDGKVTPLNFAKANLKVNSVDGDTTRTSIVTDFLGYHNVNFSYTNSEKQTVNFDYAYSVVLTADDKAFNYDYKKVPVPGTESFVYEAEITGLRNANHGSIMIVPSKVTAPDIDDPKIERVYKVVKLGGDGVFKNDNKLSILMMPDSIREIGDHTFDGCLNLTSVNSFAQLNKSDLHESTIGADDLEIMAERDYIEGFVNAIGLDGAENLNEIVMPDVLTQVATKEMTNVPSLTADLDENGNQQIVDGKIKTKTIYTSYTVTTTHKITVNKAPDLFKNYDGEIYLIDTPENRKYAEDNLKDKADKVHYYIAGEKEYTRGTMFKVDGYTQTKKQVDYDAALKPNAKIGVGEDMHKNGIWYFPEVICHISNEIIEDGVVVKPATEISDYYFKGIRTGAFWNIISLDTSGWAKPLTDKRLVHPDTIILIERGSLAENSEMIPIVFDIRSDTVLSPIGGLSKGVQKIGKHAFANTPNMRNLEMPNSVNLLEIGDSAFKNSGLEKIDLSAATKLTKIGDSAFENCSYLTAVKLPSSVKEIGNRAFYQCASLSALTGYDVDAAGISGFTFVGAYSFYGCHEFVPFKVSDKCFVGFDAFAATKKPEPPVEPPVDPPVEPPVDPPVDPPIDPSV